MDALLISPRGLRIVPGIPNPAPPTWNEVVKKPPRYIRSEVFNGTIIPYPVVTFTRISNRADDIVVYEARE